MNKHMKQIACAWLNLPVTTRKKYSASILAVNLTYKTKSNFGYSAQIHFPWIEIQTTVTDS